MRSCREPSCIGWPLLPSDQYCSWCGQRLVEVEVGFESKLGDEWVLLDPPVLNRERPPSLRLRVGHSGEAGHLRLHPADFRLSAGWLELDYSSLGDTPLKPGDALQFPVKKLKVPTPEDLPHEIRINIGQQEVKASTSLTFVPAPEFALELSASEVVLASDSHPYLEASLVLRRGRIWLESAPVLEPGWATLEAADEEQAAEGLELDALERPRYTFRFRFSAEELATLRQRSADQVQPLLRSGQVRFTYLDRGQKSSAGYRETLQAELPIQLQFILAPELYLEPFGYELRRDWFVVQGLRTPAKFSLTLHNGPPGSAPRQELLVQQLRVRDLDQGEEFPVESSEPPPWRVLSDQPLTLRVGLPRSLRESHAPQQRRLQIVPVSNDPVQRLFHLRCHAQQAESFPGYVVVDLGTTATCAALVSETKQVHRLELDGEGELASATCYLRWVGEKKLEIGRKALQRALDPAASRAVVSQAKRRVGDEDRPFEVVPLDEPGETVLLPAAEALAHLYREVFDQALHHRLASGSSEVLLQRVLITHPSRFSLRQVQLLKSAATTALQEHWRQWTGGLRIEGELVAPLTLHEPVGAAFFYLRDWRNLREVHARLGGDQLSWHLLVYDLGGGTLDVTLLKLESTQQACPAEEEELNGFAYQVTPAVVGSTGERWFGGQDVTLSLLELMWQRLSEALGDWVWPDPALGGSQRVAFQRNQNLLGHWCERAKLRLVHAGDAEESWHEFPGITVLENGRERLVTASHWKQHVTLPNLEALQETVRPRLQQSLKRVQRMLERQGLAHPDVVMRVGKASQLPVIPEALASAFPASLHVAPQQLKGCVVEGACVPPLPGLPSGVQLSRGSRRPGVRFRWKAQDSYTATTCRLGLQILDSGETWFQEVLAEGVPIPPEGLSGTLEGLLLEPGRHTLVVLENAGHEDRLVRNGKPNEDIQPLARCEVDVPDTLREDQFEQLMLRFDLLPDWTLQVRLLAPEWDGMEILRLDGALVGRQY
jgi:molecular chaperone DnaK (HSP70)